jgi:phage terminase large subunit-like protein
VARRPSSLRSAQPKRLGSETPRVFTPPLRPLTPETSKGFACIEFAEAILEVHLLPWQKWLLIHALELNENGTYRFRTVVLLVARQNGKSTLMQVLSLWRMFVEGAPLVIGTAQNLDVAEEQWAGAVELVESIPELADMIAPGGVVKVNGKKALRLTTGERYKVAAASRRGGRGLSGDLVLLDELREHQNWEAWGAVTKTTMARALAQVWAASNAGDIASVVLRHLRTIAHRALGYPDGEEGMAVLTDDSRVRGC